MPDAPERPARTTDDGAGSEVRSRANLELLVEVARRVAQAGLDRGAILEAVSWALSGTLGDGCFFCVAAPSVRPPFAALAHADPEVLSLGRAFDPEIAAEPRPPLSVRNRGSGKYPRTVPPAEAQADVVPAHARAFLDRLGACGVISASLREGDELVTLIVWRERAELPYTEDDARLLLRVAEHAALALENARVHRETRHTALQQERILSGASHDIRNSLHVVAMQHRILVQQIASLEDPGLTWLNKPLDRIGQATTRMNAIVGEIIDVARLRAGERLMLDLRSTDIVEIAQTVVEEVRLVAHDRGIWLTSPEPALVGRWDRVRIERVLANLVSNAVKYSPGGSDVEIGVARSDDGAAAIVVVRDRGMGIPEGDRPHVFDWFHRASNVGRRIEGTGVGLASARQIVEQHGGSITVESREGEGSTFTVLLPLEPPDPDLDPRRSTR